MLKEFNRIHSGWSAVFGEVPPEDDPENTAASCSSDQNESGEYSDEEPREEDDSGDSNVHTPYVAGQ